MYKSVVFKSLMLVKVSGFIAKLSLFFTAISTIATLLNTIESEMGWAIDAVCVATYILARSFSMYGYEKTQHIPPVRKENSYSFTSDSINSSAD